jgi:two-component system, NarL family, response regulator NreC
MTMAKIRVLIVDDHAVVRAGLRMLVEAQPDMAVVGEAGDGREAVRLACEADPDVVTMDVTMPGLSGIKTVERLRRECPRARVLVLTMHDDTAYLQAALAAGASGYVLKTAEETELLAAIRAVHRGHTFVDTQLTQGLVQTLLSPKVPDDTPDPKGPLSQREREVLQLLAEGHANRVIAERLFLSVKTIETYRTRIAEKLGLRTRADLVRYAIETGLLGSSPPAPDEGRA